MEATSDLAPPLTADQESEIENWVLEEYWGGTVVPKELIFWFAGRVIQRDASRISLGRGFVDNFLDRHPSLKETLSLPPPRPVPGRPPPKAEKGVRLKPQDRLKAMREQDRTVAKFGDSPPPLRRPAPYPEGEIIYQCNENYIVRHGETVTKYTTYHYGMGANDHPNEALVLRFVKENTTIPVPKVISSDWDRITMEYIPGQTLKQAWPVLTSDERSTILDELRGYITQLRALTNSGAKIGCLDGHGVELPTIIPRAGGPFESLTELHHWLVRPPKRLESQTMYWHQITSQLGADYPIVFTHGDLAARNVMVRDGHIVAILDWEFAGWYPEYWDYVFTLRGMDNIDWETLGSQVPALFARRYDLEYILMKFILDIS